MILSPHLLLLPSALALLAYAYVALAGEARQRALRVALVGAWLAHGAAVVIDIAGIGSPVSAARFGFAPALSATLWVVVAVYGIESRLVPLPGARRVLAWTAIAAIALAATFPGQVRPHADSAWAPLHWLLGLASYGLFGAAVLHASLLDSVEHRMRTPAAAPAPGVGMPLLQLERLTFRFVTAGFALLSAAIVLAFMLAPHWKWDHKAVLSVLGWAVFAALLGGRQVFGWRGRRATRWLYVGTALLLLAYVGSRFVFEVVLRRPVN
jgi:ABC-type uncharacterized transport system permease subunit